MDPGDVRRIEQVVGDVQVVAIDGHVVAIGRSPLGVSPMLGLEDVGRVGAICVAHPDPQQSVARFDGVRVDDCSLRWVVAPRCLHTLPGAIEHQAVVPALDVVALHPAHRQRHLAMRACIGEGAVRTAGAAVDGDVLAQDRGRVRPVADLAFPRCDVPGVAEKHPSERSPTGLLVRLVRQAGRRSYSRSAHRTAHDERHRWRRRRAAVRPLAPDDCRPR